MSVLGILNKMAATSSRNEKEAILMHNKDNGLLAATFRLAYDPSIRFFISDRAQLAGAPTACKDPTCLYDMSTMPLEVALEKLVNEVSTRKRTGHDARDYVFQLAAHLHPDDREVFLRVLEKDLKVNATDSTANKVWPELVPEHEVMLAHADLKKIKYPAYSQLKADGARCHLVTNNLGQAVLLTRQGKLIEHHGVFDVFAQQIMDAAPKMSEATSGVFDGELVCFENGVPLSRKTSNGIINKAIKGTITPAEAKMIHFICWDFVDGGKHPYSMRFQAVTNMIKELNPSNVHLIHSIEVQDYEEAVKHFKELRSQGYEGTILKNKDAKWVGKRSYDLCKMKAVNEIELKCIAFEPGKPRSKYEKMLGAITCVDGDGKILVSVGSGFSDEERELYKNGDLVGKVVTVEYNERITSKAGEQESLFLPRFVNVRLDKSTPNSYNEILAIEEATLKA